MTSALVVGMQSLFGRDGHVAEAAAEDLHGAGAPETKSQLVTKVDRLRLRTPAGATLLVVPRDFFSIIAAFVELARIWS